MQLNFRQGIVANQLLPKFLQKNIRGNINFDASVSQTVLNFIDGSSNYLKYESISIEDAWIVPQNQACWLYWDINIEDASRTFGYTLQNPFLTTIPSNPEIDQMFFDTDNNVYKAWNGINWAKVIRIIAGYVDASGNVLTQATGSQVNLYITCVSDQIVFDDVDLPIKLYTDNGFEFYNKTTILNFKNTSVDSFTYDRLLKSCGISDVDITKHYCVVWSTENHLTVADPSLTTQPAFALAERSSLTGELVNLIFEGFVVNKTDWLWTYPSGTPLFLSNDGTLSVSVDATLSIQRVGYIVSPNTIYINFDTQYIKH